MAFVSPLSFSSNRSKFTSSSITSTPLTPSIQATRRRACPQMLVVEATSTSDMDKIIQAADESLVVVDYSTSWCGPCKVIAPIFEEMSEKYTDVVFVKVMGDSTPEATELMKREGIRAVPAFHFWKSESKVKEFTGAASEDLEKAILSLK